MSKILRVALTSLSSILLFSASYSQTEKQRIDAYVNQYKDLAIEEMLRTGVPASITLAQGIVETGGGQSDLAALANNHFGIKCKSDWTGETMLHNDDAKNECFRKYATALESYKDHSDFLKSRPGYAFLFKLDPTDYEGWARGLKRAGYATNPAYAQKLIKLIVENGLQDYTLLALNSANTNNENLAANGNNVFNATEASVSVTAQSAAAKSPLIVSVSDEKMKSASYPVNSVFTINESKVIFAEAGTSLFALANNYNISLKKLLEYNELAEDADILSAPELIFLEKKPKKGAKDIHIVEANETIREISQKEGIQLTTVMEYNGLQKGMEPARGEKIYLKFPAPSSPRLATSGSHHPVTNM